jgi:hypothetical protein
LLSNVGGDFRLVEGSLNIVPGDPTVANGEVSFPVTARAAKVRLLDSSDLLARVKGQTTERARAVLGEFGEVEISTWPDWVSAIPTNDARITIEIAGQDGAAPPAAGPGAQTPRPTASSAP